MLYSKCTNTPMQVFIDVQVSKDVKYLGDGTQEELLESWGSIIEEYQSLTNDTSSNYLFELRKSIEYLDKRLVILRISLDYMEKHNSKLVADWIADEYGYTGDSVAIWNRAKSEMHKLKIKEAELEKQQAASPQTEHSAFDWIKNIEVLSQFRGFKFNTKEETIAEYIALLNNFKIANTPKNGR